MKPSVRIRWTPIGLMIEGATVEVFRSVVAVLQQDRSELGDNAGTWVARYVTELRAQGCRVQIVIIPGGLLRHRAPECHRVYTAAEWGALPEVSVDVPASSVEGVTVSLPSRMCGCGSHITYASLEVVEAQSVCNAQGGAA